MNSLTLSDAKPYSHKPEDLGPMMSDSEMGLSNTLEMGLGEEVGYFNLGSTIVLIFEAPKKLKFGTGQKIIIGKELILN